MAYADEETGNRRLIAIGIVAALHAAAGYGIAKIGWSGVNQLVEDLKTFDVAPEEKPKEEKPPPPPPKVDIPPPPRITAPPPIVHVNPVSTNTVPDTTPPPPPPPPPVPAPPPLVVVPPAPKVAQKAVQRGGSISNDDYPPSAKRNEESGTTVARFTIGTDGRIADCSASGASPTLDATTCDLIRRRFKFKPALDGSGNPIAETRSQKVRWQLTDN
jgi:periplasmic protein TonB